MYKEDKYIDTSIDVCKEIRHLYHDTKSEVEELFYERQMKNSKAEIFRQMKGNQSMFTAWDTRR